MTPVEAAIPSKSEKIVAAKRVDGSNSLNFITIPGATVSNHHLITVDTIGSDYAYKGRSQRAKKC